MKKLFFASYSLDIGGIETSLVTLLNNLGEKYEITLCLEKKEGNTPYIVLSTLYDMKIKLTDSKTEDKVINLFFYINCKIEQESQKFNKYNELKKGLIQSMFI